MSKTSIPEIPEFHPLVAKWLEQNGYDYQHEVKLPDGRCDFVAVHKQTGEKLAIECKTDSNASSGRFFAQSLDYARQLSEHTPAVAMPIYKFTERAKQVCEHYGIKVILIDVEKPAKEKFREAGKSPSEDILFHQAMNRLSFLEQPANVTIEEICKYHQQRGTLPYMDLLMALHISHKGFKTDEDFNKTYESLLAQKPHHAHVLMACKTVYNIAFPMFTLQKILGTPTNELLKGDTEVTIDFKTNVLNHFRQDKDTFDYAYSEDDVVEGYMFGASFWCIEYESSCFVAIDENPTIEQIDKLGEIARTLYGIPEYLSMVNVILAIPIDLVKSDIACYALEKGLIVWAFEPNGLGYIEIK